MSTSHRYYQSYLLRIWKENPDGELRASLQNVASGECRNYASLTDLYDYLSQQAERDFIQELPSRSTPALRMLDE
jgi:hypothetical protein